MEGALDHSCLKLTNQLKCCHIHENWLRIVGKLEYLETFLKVVEANSLALAAKRLGLSAAAVSKQIAALEKEMKVQLLSRTTRRLELTELGSIYYEQGKKVMKSKDDLDAVMNSMLEEPSGELNVLSSRVFAESCIVPHLREFLSQFPKVNLNLTILGNAADLARGDVDVFFGITHALSPEKIQKEIDRGYFSLYASPAYLQAHGVPKHPMELPHHSFITYSVRESCQQLSFNNGTQVYLNPVIRVNDTRMMVACALQGLGFIKLHKLESEKYLSAGELVEILPEFREAPQPIFIGYLQEKYLLPKVRRFIEFFTEKIGVYV